MIAFEFITDRQIYERVIQEAVPSAKRFLWLATADPKDLHVHCGKGMVQFLAVLSSLIADGWVPNARAASDRNTVPIRQGRDNLRSGTHYD